MRKLVLAFSILVSLVFLSSPVRASKVEDTMIIYLNLNGYTCLRVLDVKNQTGADTYEVRCVEDKGETKTVDYVVRFKKGEVVRR